MATRGLKLGDVLKPARGPVDTRLMYLGDANSLLFLALVLTGEKYGQFHKGYYFNWRVDEEWPHERPKTS